MGLSAYVFDSPLGNCSNKGLSSKFKKVTIVNVEGPFEPSPEAPAVKLMKRVTGNLICMPVELIDSGKWVMFGGAYICSTDSRFSEAVQKLSGYDHGFPVALHDRVES
jgi:hypothetical protein